MAKMLITEKKIKLYLSADDAEPKCIYCDQNPDYCMDGYNCGPEHGWSRFSKTVEIDRDKSTR